MRSCERNATHCIVIEPRDENQLRHVAHWAQTPAIEHVGVERAPQHSALLRRVVAPWRLLAYATVHHLVIAVGVVLLERVEGFCDL